MIRRRKWVVIMYNKRLNSLQVPSGLPWSCSRASQWGIYLEYYDRSARRMKL
jgi:hypothetical protein